MFLVRSDVAEASNRRVMILRIILVGAGVIGTKRAAALGPEAKIVAVFDRDKNRAEALADRYGAWPFSVFPSDTPHDVVIVSTRHDTLSEIAATAIESGKHVLVEKPGGRTPEEVLRLARALDAHPDRVLRVGCNHRFHPALQEAKRRLPEIGPLMSIRARYGHGGRVGYEEEWRADPAISGGGELIDQGVHLIDLVRWLSGSEVNLVWASMSRLFWDMPVEDNAFVALAIGSNQGTAFLHASCTEWKNLFSFEVFGRSGKIEVTGLGRSYGVETFRLYRMDPVKMGPPSVETIEYADGDVSWRQEWLGFVRAIAGEKTDNATVLDALRTLEVVADAYGREER